MVPLISDELLEVAAPSGGEKCKLKDSNVGSGKKMESVMLVRIQEIVQFGQDGLNRLKMEHGGQWPN